MCTFRAKRGGDPENFAGDSGPYYGQLTVEVTIWPSPRLFFRNYAKKVVFFMLFGHSEAENGPQGCRKMPKKSFELDFSKEALISQNG